MRKSSLIISSVAVAVLIFAGCGGGDNSENTTKTGTSYYVDSGIEGVHYTCGSQTGITGKEGKFIFEKGQNCSFSIAGITLRTVEADQLADGKKILENDIEVARFLQSVDTDGNPDNGIQISPEVLEVLNEALQEYKSGNEKTIKDVVKDDTVLENVVSTVEDKVEDFQGKVVNEEQAKEHLEKTQTKITKELLAGKTFYIVEEDKGELWMTQVVVSEDGKYWNYQDIKGLQTEHPSSGKESIDISGDTLIIHHPEEENPDPYTVEEEDGYIKLINKNDNSVLRFYIDKTKAEEYYNQLAGSSGSDSDGNSNDTLDGLKFNKSWLKQHTLYDVFPDDGKWEISKLTFDDTYMWSDEYKFTYTITDDGYIKGKKPKEWNEGDGDFYVAISEIDDTVIKVCWRKSIDAVQRCKEKGEFDEYLFLDSNEAKEFRDSKNK